MGLFRKRTSTRGHLVLVGGAEETSGNRRLLRRAVELNGGSRVVVIPAATRFPGRLSRKYVRAFRALGATDVQVLPVHRRSDADRCRLAQAAEDANLIWFSGGDQVRLVRLLGGSAVLDAVRRAHERGATVAGTSAGAAAASDPMLYDGQEGSLVKGRVRHEGGFGFLDGITVDTHFDERGRYGRLAQFLASGRSRRGLGLSENTALFVDPEGIGEVAGAGPVVVLRADGLSFNDYEEVEEGRPLSMAGLEIGFLSDGTRFDLRRWCVVR
jgi:cyanophycinase